MEYNEFITLFKLYVYNLMVDNFFFKNHTYTSNIYVKNINLVEFINGIKLCIPYFVYLHVIDFNNLIIKRLKSTIKNI